MKILAIGNSFSEDATRYIQDIAKSAGEDLYIRNCYIGGCSLERHVNNVITGAEAYDYQENASKVRMISLQEAIKEADWDYVTVQQVSGLSGVYESYEPYLSQLLLFIKTNLPNVKIAFHRTWAYEIESPHGDFPRYNRNQNTMFEKICEASSKAAEKHGLEIIKCGNAIQLARETIPYFDYKNGGKSLCRDTYHMSLPYGRYLLGLVWFKFFTHKSCDLVKYIPDGADEEVISQLKKLVNSME